MTQRAGSTQGTSVKHIGGKHTRNCRRKQIRKRPERTRGEVERELTGTPWAKAQDRSVLLNTVAWVAGNLAEAGGQGSRDGTRGHLLFLASPNPV